MDQVAKTKLDSMINKTNNPIIKSILMCFDINDYRKRGRGETKDRIYKSIESLRDRREEIKNTIKAISSNGEKPDNTNSMDTYDLIELLMYKINKKMPRKCKECTNITMNQLIHSNGLASNVIHVTYQHICACNWPLHMFPSYMKITNH